MRTAEKGFKHVCSLKPQRSKERGCFVVDSFVRLWCWRWRCDLPVLLPGIATPGNFERELDGRQGETHWWKSRRVPSWCTTGVLNSENLLKDVMDVPRLRCAVLGWETQVHDTQLQDAEAQVFAGRGAGQRRNVGLLATGLFVLAQLCGQRSLLQTRSSEEGGPLAFSEEEGQGSWFGSQAAVLCGGSQGGSFACFHGSDAGNFGRFCDSPGRTCRDGRFGTAGGDQAEAQRARQGHLQARGCRRSRVGRAGGGSKSGEGVRPGWWRLRRSRWMPGRHGFAQCGRYAGGTQIGTPQQWAAGFAAAVPPEIAKQFQSWLGSVSPDAMMHGQPRCRRPLELGCIGRFHFDGFSVVAGSLGVRPVPCRRRKGSQ